MQSCPRFRIVVSKSEISLVKSGCASRIRKAQQLSPFLHVLGSPFFFTHLLLNPSIHKPRSNRTLRIPLGSPTSSRFGASFEENTIRCVWFEKVVSCIFGCAPPGFRFIRLATRASSANAACPLELSKAKIAFFPGNRFSKIGIAFSYT